MPLDDCCIGDPKTVSNPSKLCFIYTAPPEQHCQSTCRQHSLCLPSDFYKDLNLKESKTAVAGEHVWGEVPNLQSYHDPMAMVESHRTGVPPDNLFTRGPFYKGLSETHEEFCNKGPVPPRKYHEYVRHYEEPGMKYNKSITQTDFGPPYPMVSQSRKSGMSSPEYVPKPKQPKNPYAKEYEPRRKQSEVCYVEEELKRDFSTETSDNYVCYQRPKRKNELRDYQTVREEVFLERLRTTHENCPYGLPHEFLCDVDECRKKTSMKDCSLREGYLMLPCECPTQT